MRVCQKKIQVCLRSSVRDKYKYIYIKYYIRRKSLLALEEEKKRKTDVFCPVHPIEKESFEGKSKQLEQRKVIRNGFAWKNASVFGSPYLARAERFAPLRSILKNRYIVSQGWMFESVCERRGCTAIVPSPARA